MLPLILLRHHATFTIIWAIFLLEVSCEIPFLFLNIAGSGILGLWQLLSIDFQVRLPISNIVFFFFFFLPLCVDGSGIWGHEY